MTINVSIQYNGGILSDIRLLAQSSSHWGTRLNAIHLQPMIPPKRFDMFSPLTGGCSKGLDTFRCFVRSGGGCKSCGTVPRKSPRSLGPFLVVSSYTI